jgi:hypothetical protein
MRLLHNEIRRSRPSRGFSDCPPASVAKLQIKVSGTLGTRTDEALITQTYFAQAHPDYGQRDRCKNKRVWRAAGGGRQW